MKKSRSFCLAILGLCLGCSASPERPRNLLVIVLDTLPAGHLGTFGYQPPGAPNPPISPNIDAFASGLPGHQTLVFEAAFSTASYTLASTASLFTGMNPVAHGVLGHNSNVLPDKHLTFAEAFSNAGFATAALSANPNVSSEGQFDQGFETFRHYFREEYAEHSLPATMIPDAGTWWRRNAGRPRLLYAHLLPPHQPYDPPAPHAGLYGSSEVPREEGLTPYLVELAKRSDLTPQSPEIKRIQSRYDAGVNYADALFGELLDGLAGEDGRGLDNTLVVLTSDHGEAFAQHGQILHGGGVNEELCHVPLLMAFPKGGLVDKGSRYDQVVSTRDLASTVCDIFDLPWPGDAKGRSFLGPALAGESTGRPALSRSAGDRPIWSLRTDTHTLIEHRASQTSMLFDRKNDPTERNNLVNEQSKTVERLTALLRSRLKSAQETGASFSSRKTPKLVHKDALELLGYF